MRIKLERGILTAAVAIGGAGAIMIAPTQLWIGYSLLALAGLALLWGVMINDAHWWMRIPRKNPIITRRGLYVGRILIFDTVLDSDNYLNLSIRAYNGTAQTVRYEGTKGHARIEFNVNGAGTGGFELQPPTLITETSPCRSGGELLIDFRLALTPAQIQDFRANQATGATMQIIFHSLQILLSRRLGRNLSMPLWDGVNFANGRVTGQLHFLKTSFAVGTSVSIGSR